MDLCGVIKIVHKSIYKYLDDDALRFLYGVCHELRNLAYEELKKRTGNGTEPILRYTTKAIYISPEMLQRNSVNWVSDHRSCVAFGYLRTFKTIYSDNLSHCNYYYELVHMYGYLEIAEYLFACGHKMSKTVANKALNNACSRGHIDMVKFRFETYTPMVDTVPDYIITQIINHGHLDIMKYLYAKKKLNFDGKKALNNCNNVDLAIWLYYTFELGESKKMIELLCINGRLDELKKFTINDEETLAMALSGACAGNQMGVLKYLHKTYVITARIIRFNNNEILRTTADFGYSHIIHYLYDTYNLNTDDGLDALFLACSGGFLTTVKAFRDIGFTIDHVRYKDNVIIKSICCDDNLIVLRFLYSDFGLTVEDVRCGDNESLFTAAMSNSLDTVKWLCNTFSLTVDDVTHNDRILPIICSEGYYDMVVWFCENYEISAENIGGEGTFRGLCRYYKKLARYVYDKFEPHFKNMLFELDGI